MADVQNSPTPEELAQLLARYKDSMANLTTPIEPNAPGSGVLAPTLPSSESQTPTSAATTELTQEDKEDDTPAPTSIKKDADIESLPENSEPSSDDNTKLLSMLGQSTPTLGTGPTITDQLKKAQTLSAIGKGVAGLSQAGNLIGSGLASMGGAQVKPLPQEMFDKEAEQANQPFENLKQQLAVQGDDPNSDVSKAAQEYAKKLGINLPGPISANALFKIMPIQEKLQANKESAESRKDVAKYRADAIAAQRDATAAAREATQSDKKNKDDINRIDKASKIISAETSSSRSAFGKAANTFRAGEALDQLAQQAQTQPGGLDKRQMAEVARNLDSMLSNGQPSVSGMDKLLPRTSSGDIAGIEEYISNIPTGIEQQQFLQRAMDTVKREKDLAHTQMQRTQAKLLAPYQDLKDHPNMKSVLEQNGLPDDILESPKNKKPANSAAPASTGSGFDISNTKDLAALRTIMQKNPDISQQDAINTLVKYKKDQNL